jgi:hypothetical protein
MKEPDDVSEVTCEHHPDESGKGNVTQSKAPLARGRGSQAFEPKTIGPFGFCGEQSFHSIAIVPLHASKFYRAFKKSIPPAHLLIGTRRRDFRLDVCSGQFQWLHYSLTEISNGQQMRRIPSTTRLKTMPLKSPGSQAAHASKVCTHRAVLPLNGYIRPD